MIFTRINLFCILLTLHFRYALCSFDIPGETSPASVEIEAGGSVNISCRMNPKVFQDRTSRDLYFINAHETHEKVPDTEIIIINDTTIIYALKNAKESRRTYRCMCGNNAIMETKVYVGHKPEAITDFICRSYNYEIMKCNFTKPENNILTQYNVSYHFDLKAYKYSPSCDHEKYPLVTCTAPHANENIFHYEIIATNSLGTRTQYFDVDNMNVMVLAAPGQNFSLKHLTSDSARFTFRLKIPSKNLQWEVVLQPKNLDAIVLSPYVHPILISNNEYQLNLTNLSYAYYDYQISLRVRLSEINSWSDGFHYWFRTLPRLPDRAPRTDVGAFETYASDKQIRLYWELLEPHEFNGYNFTYVVEQISPMTTQSIKPFLESNSAVFFWNKEYPYEFHIRSQNHLGMSKTFSQITIPAMVLESKRKLHTPPEVHNMYHERNETFTLNWSAPKVEEGLIDYTVYWCRKRSLLLNGCEGSIHFQHVRRNILNFTTAPQEHPLSLAVSANYKDFNTGMHWTECTVAETTDLVKMEPKVEATSATSIKVEWGSENMCPSILSGYNLSYCAVDLIHRNKIESDTYNCIETESEQYLLINKTIKRWELQNLKPYTHYKIEIFMFSQHKFGKKSNPQIVQTMEAAPTAPRQLEILSKSNTSATISWLPPIKTNGRIRSYIVFFNMKSIKYPILANETDEKRLTYRLENLSTSTSYHVHVLAQTVPNAISSPSNEINFTTFVGYPLKPGPITLLDTKNDAEIEWIVPPGRVDFYEISVTLMKGDEILGQRISIIIGSTSNSCTFRIPKCFDHEYRTTVGVRSVSAALIALEVDTHENFPIDDADDVHHDEQLYDDSGELSCNIRLDVDENEMHSYLKKQKAMIERYSNKSVYRLYKSDWQRGPIFSCAAVTFGRVMMYIALATIFAGCIVMVIYLMRQKYNKMANINCTLPAGLDAYMTKDFSTVGAVLSHNFLTVIKGDGTNNQCSSNIIEDRDDALTQHTASDSIAQNEEHCLLEATSLNSLCINDSTHQLDFKLQQKQQQNSSTSLLDNKTHFKRHFELPLESELDGDCCSSGNNTSNDSFNIESPYIQATEILNHCNNNNNNNGTMSMIPNPNSYIKPNALNNWQNINQNNFENMNQEPNYVSADSVCKISPSPLQNKSISVYTNGANIVGKSDMDSTNLFLNNKANSSNLTANNTNSGYTTLEQLNKLTLAPTSNAHNETGPEICGYVTQKDLTAFGHQQQHNFS